MNITRVVFISLLFAGGSALAQERPNPPPSQPPQQPPSPPAMPQQAKVSESELEKFVDIYVDVQGSRDQLAEQLSEAANQQEAQEIQARMREQIVEVIQDHGWSLEKYNRVANAINNDSDTREAALELINEQSS